MADSDLIKVLDVLLEIKEKNEIRRGRQQEIFSDPELEGFTLEQPRSGRQISSSLEDDLLGFERDEICERTGFETRKREECQVSTLKYCSISSIESSPTS